MKECDPGDENRGCDLHELRLYLEGHPSCSVFSLAHLVGFRNATFLPAL
jgi:hypothetical protein